jgi:hypothetical protein
VVATSVDLPEFLPAYLVVVTRHPENLHPEQSRPSSVSAIEGSVELVEQVSKSKRKESATTDLRDSISIHHALAPLDMNQPMPRIRAPGSYQEFMMRALDEERSGVASQ